MLCDPIHRLLSDFKHVTHDWGNDKPNRINRKFTGPDSVRFPFKNMNFNEMVQKFLPMFQKNNIDKNQSIAFEIFEYF